MWIKDLKNIKVLKKGTIQLNDVWGLALFIHPQNYQINFNLTIFHTMYHINVDMPFEFFRMPKEYMDQLESKSNDNQM